MDNKIFSNEEEFLKEYDSSIFEKPSITADIAILSVSSGDKDSYRRLSEKRLSVLLCKRDTYPFKNKWCLPGSFVGMNETIDEAAIRILSQETNMKDIYLEQLFTFSDVHRDPRMRVISTTYMALIDKNTHGEKLHDKAAWFTLSVNEADDIITYVLENEQTELEFSVKKILVEPTTSRYEYKVIKNESLAFDHASVITAALVRLKNKLEYTDIVFNMMPEEFTLGELQQVYEVILGKKLLDPAFRRIIADKVEKTKNYQKGGGHRPSVLFRFKRK